MESKACVRKSCPAGHLEYRSPVLSLVSMYQLNLNAHDKLLAPISNAAAHCVERRTHCTCRFTLTTPNRACLPASASRDMQLVAFASSLGLLE